MNLFELVLDVRQAGVTEAPHPFEAPRCLEHHARA